MRIIVAIIELFDRLTGIVSRARRADERDHAVRVALRQEAERARRAAARAEAESAELKAAVDAENHDGHR